MALVVEVLAPFAEKRCVEAERVKDAGAVMETRLEFTRRVEALAESGICFLELAEKNAVVRFGARGLEFGKCRFGRQEGILAKLNFDETYTALPKFTANVVV
jgi:hypothetical protein